jgi:hypothetical protein
VLTANIIFLNFMKPNFSKIRIISFSRKMYMLNYQYRLANSLVLRTDSIEDLSAYIDCELHVHFLFSYAMKLLGLIYKISFSFSIIDSLLMLYFLNVQAYSARVWTGFGWLRIRCSCVLL